MARIVKTTNQIPLPHRAKQDKEGNTRYRLFLKDGTSTMLLASGLTKPACNVLSKWLSEKIRQFGGKKNGVLLIIK